MFNKGTKYELMWICKVMFTLPKQVQGPPWQSGCFRLTLDWYIQVRFCLNAMSLHSIKMAPNRNQNVEIVKRVVLLWNLSYMSQNRFKKEMTKKKESFKLKLTYIWCKSECSVSISWKLSVAPKIYIVSEFQNHLQTKSDLHFSTRQSQS